MDAKTILTKAINKALGNGWNPQELGMGTNADKGRYILKMTKPFHTRGIIMSHEFAKALWPRCEHVNDDDLCGLCGNGGWQYHLQQMVIAADPIKYLGEHI